MTQSFRHKLEPNVAVSRFAGGMLLVTRYFSSGSGSGTEVLRYKLLVTRNCSNSYFSPGTGVLFSGTLSSSPHLFTFCINWIKIEATLCQVPGSRSSF